MCDSIGPSFGDEDGEVREDDAESSKWVKQILQGNSTYLIFALSDIGEIYGFKNGKWKKFPPIF